MRQIEIDPGKMLSSKGVLIDSIYDKLNLHIHQANKEEGVLDVVPRRGQMRLVFRTNIECPGLVVIHVSERDVLVFGPGGGECFADFVVDVEDDGHTSFGNI